MRGIYSQAGAHRTMQPVRATLDVTIKISRARQAPVDAALGPLAA
jgi:hypothetical protein